MFQVLYLNVSVFRELCSRGKVVINEKVSTIRGSLES